MASVCPRCDKEHDGRYGPCADCRSRIVGDVSQSTDFDRCMHCGKPVKYESNFTWWDINEIAGWVCNHSIAKDTVQTYRTIRRRLKKGLIAPAKHPPSLPASPDLPPPL